MSAITFKRFGKLYVIPGGWEAKVPEVTADHASRVTYTRYFGSEKLAASAIQRTFEAGFIRGLRAAIVRLATEYLTLNPNSFVRDTTPKGDIQYQVFGFDPEAAQTLYAPFENTGRRGKPFKTPALKSMT